MMGSETFETMLDDGSGGVGITAAEIEQELSRIWQAPEKNPGDSIGTVRSQTCVMNLIVVTSDDERARELSELTTEIAQQHPARIIILVDGPSGDRALPQPFDVEVSAQKSVYQEDSFQPSYERVLIDVHHRSNAEIVKLIGELSRQELPVCLWWDAQGSNRHQPGLFDALMEFADYTIIDSENGGTVANVTPSKTKPAIDLCWEGIRPWREITANIFDHIGCRWGLNHIDQVQIDHTMSPRQAMLYSVWLSRCLRWHPVTGKRNPTTGEIVYTARRARKETTRFALVPHQESAAAPHRGITRVHITASDGDRDGTFTIFVCPDDPSALRATIEVTGQRPVDHILAHPLPDVPELLRNALQQSDDERMASRVRETAELVDHLIE